MRGWYSLLDSHSHRIIPFSCALLPLRSHRRARWSSFHLDPEFDNIHQVQRYAQCVMRLSCSSMYLVLVCVLKQLPQIFRFNQHWLVRYFLALSRGEVKAAAETRRDGYCISHFHYHHRHVCSETSCKCFLKTGENTTNKCCSSSMSLIYIGDATTWTLLN